MDLYCHNEFPTLLFAVTSGSVIPDLSLLLSRASSRKFPWGGGGGAKIAGFSKILGGGGAMHLATLMHSRLCHLLYNDVICIVGVSRG